MGIELLNKALQKHLNNDDSCIDSNQLQEWRKLYPYFSLPLMLYTQHNKNDKEALSLSTIYAGDIEQWATRLGIKPSFDKLYPQDCRSSHITTDSTIDIFLETYGKESEYETDLNLSTLIEPQAHNNDCKEIDEGSHTPLLTIPAYDYMSQLESMPDAYDATPLQHDDLLEKFLQADAAGEQLFSRPEFHPSNEAYDTHKHLDENEANDTLFSESLAKIYIQQRRYAKALEIIRKLNLNNPEKNIYFADQIRFLEKLIINVKN